MSIMSCQGVLPQQVLCLASFTSALSISYRQRIVSALASAMCPIFADAGLSQSQRDAITPGLHHADSLCLHRLGLCAAAKWRRAGVDHLKVVAVVGSHLHNLRNAMCVCIKSILI